MPGVVPVVTETLGFTEAVANVGTLSLGPRIKVPLIAHSFSGVSSRSTLAVSVVRRIEPLELGLQIRDAV